MKVGSIVVVLFHDVDKDIKHRVKWYPVMDEKTPYVIRGIDTCPVTKFTICRFEEGVIGHNLSNKEYGVASFCVREIMPPGEISEEIKEILSEPISEDA